MLRPPLSLVAVAVALAAALAPAGAQRITYPTPKASDQVDVMFGHRIPDPYRWMEDLGAPATAEFVSAENRVTDAWLAAAPGRDVLRRRLTALYDYPRVSTPFYEGGRYFYRRNTGLQKQSVLYSRASLGAAPSLVIDPNTLSPDGSVAMAAYAPSPDGRWVAYGQSEGGADWTTYYVRDLATGKQSADTVRWLKGGGVSWTRDGAGFFYDRYPEPTGAAQMQAALHDAALYYHRLGTPQSKDEKIFAQPEHPSWFVYGGVDESGRYLMIYVARGTENRNALYYADLGDPKHPDVAAPVRAVYTAFDASYNPLVVDRGTLYLQTNLDAPKGKIVAAKLGDPSPSQWRTVVAEGKNSIENVTTAGGLFAVQTLDDVASALTLYTTQGATAGTVTLPGLGSVGGMSGRWDRPELFYSYTSPLYPPTVFRYDLKMKASTPFEAPPRTFDPSGYVTERVFYPSRDGTRVPMFITHRKGIALDGTNPTMLYAYGGFDVSITPYYSASIPLWLELGGVYATANLRGGGEYGEAWHEAGMFAEKQNVFDDFIGAAEYLVRQKYTSPAKLAINGGSNGGLLIGAVMEQRPDLFGVAVPDVGVMDMLRYHKFTGGQAWASEYGSADDSTALQYLVKYSPLHNVKAGVCYPSTLITTADHDDRVVPSHSYKFAATLQQAQQSAPNCDRPVLLRVETSGSHTYSSTDRQIANSADMWAFVAKELGVTVKPAMQ